eukprot:13501-Heterococcus_DN1.PRE.2
MLPRLYSTIDQCAATVIALLHCMHYCTPRPTHSAVTLQHMSLCHQYKSYARKCVLYDNQGLFSIGFAAAVR